MIAIDDDRHVQAADRRHVESGLWVFILLDLFVFTSFFATALYYRAMDPGVYREGQAALSVNPALLNTVLLLTGSLLVFRGVTAARRRSFEATKKFFLFAALCGVAFVAVKIYEYTHLVLGGHTLQSSAFFVCYFGFTAVHLVHVLIATAALTWVAFEIPNRKLGLWAVNSGNYWHMVDLLWLLLLPVLYLV